MNALLHGLSAPERDVLALLRRMERHPRLTFGILFCLALGSYLAFAVFKGWPIPSLHDEFSYLLSADTFFHGRFANPSHPLYPHFETFHVLQKPSYASKYPPFPGALLALGQCLGQPAIGIFLGSALAVAVLYWALLPLLGHFWSLFASFLAWSQFAPYSFYSASYMSGNVSALGACLLLGSAVRLVREIRPYSRNAVIMGSAVFILAASRPFEGLISCLGIGLLLAGKFCTLSGPLKKEWGRKIVIPGALTLFGGTVLLLSYNRSVTGAAGTLPYSVYEATHSQTPLFIWGKPGTQPLPDTPQLKEFEMQFAVPAFENERSKSFAARFSERFAVMLKSFIPFWFPGIVLLLLSAFSSSRWNWFAWMMILVFMTACSFTVWFSRHYLGCLLPFLCLISCFGAIQLCSFQWRNRPWGRHLFRLILGTLFLLQITLTLLAPPALARGGDFTSRRQSIEKKLEGLPGLDLILVSYGPSSSVHEEWVYNAANIDHSEIVWAHSLGAEADEKLILYFSNRRIWHLQVNQKNPEPVELIPSPK